MNSKGLWPITVMVVALLAAVVFILRITPNNDTAARSVVLALIGILGPLLSGIWVTRHTQEVREKIDEVKKQVNGRMSQLIDKVPGHACPECDARAHRPSPKRRDTGWEDPHVD